MYATLQMASSLPAVSLRIWSNYFVFGSADCSSYAVGFSVLLHCNLSLKSNMCDTHTLGLKLSEIHPVLEIVLRLFPLVTSCAYP